MTRAPSEIELAWKALGQLAIGITPARIVGEPDKNDALKITDDLRLFARIVDRVIVAYGKYASETFGSHRIDMDLFKDQLSGALEGNAIYEIEQAGRDIETEREDADTLADMRRELQAAD